MHKEELNLQRKLQQVEEDNTDITSDDAEGPNYPVSVNTTKNTGPVSTTNKLAFIQIIRFFSLRVVVTKITFGVHFYYYRRRISSIVLFRLYVSYHSRLRNLQDIIPDAESVGTTCYLKDTQLNNTYVEGEKVEYSCEANSTYNAETANITVDRDVNLKIRNDTTGELKEVDFRDINFNGIAAVQVDNLKIAINDIGEEFLLNNTIVTDYSNTYLKIKGFRWST